jgi:hypothetical protein
MSALLPSSSLFEQNKIRRLYDEATETWWFSVIDIVSIDPTARLPAGPQLLES